MEGAKNLALKYFIKTYSNHGDVILDNCMGSGSTCIACINMGRKYIGIERDREYYEIAQGWIDTYLEMIELQGFPKGNDVPVQQVSQTPLEIAMNAL